MALLALQLERRLPTSSKLFGLVQELDLMSDELDADPDEVRMTEVRNGLERREASPKKVVEVA